MGMTGYFWNIVIQVNVEAELEGAAEDLGRMAVWDQIQASLSIQDGFSWTKAEFCIVSVGRSWHALHVSVVEKNQVPIFTRLSGFEKHN